MKYNILGVLAFTMLFAGIAQGQALYQDGVHYKTLTEKQPTESDGQVEVIEFFSYACPHCRDFDPHVQAWKKKLPDGVKIRYIPVVFNKSWEPLAQTYYAAEALGVLDKVHKGIFVAVHDKHTPVNSPEEIADVVAKLGVDRKAFLEAMNDFNVDSKLRRSMQLARAYKISGVPTVAINGKYMTTGSLAGTYPDFIGVMDYLTKKELATNKKKK